MTRLIDTATYPMVVASTVAVYVVLASAMPPTFASYIAVAGGASAITVLEILRPHRQRWRPDQRTILNDAVFLAVVQMMLPVIVTLPVTIWLSGRISPSGFQTFWPHDQPILVQVVAMLVVGDFFRYWMHRAAHQSTRLWQFHAVHHSPKKLYWLNVGRFHPFEKAVQLLVDSLPFALLGVDDKVLAGYFVFYAINGFFQHSNCRVRLGFLNYVVAGPELHRWHHSRIIDESDRNFGNNLIVWDTLFGTRYLPADREVDELGLLNPMYPDGFVEQLTTPFQFGLEKANYPTPQPDQAGQK